MPKADRKAGMRMDTPTFLHIWSKALKRDPEDEPSQMDFMVKECMEQFLSKDSRFREHNADFLSENPHSTEGELQRLEKVVAKRIYSKCSNLRKKFKDNGFEVPDYPQKGFLSYEPDVLDFAAIMNLEKVKPDTDSDGAS